MQQPSDMSKILITISVCLIRHFQFVSSPHVEESFMLIDLSFSCYALNTDSGVFTYFYAQDHVNEFNQHYTQPNKSCNSQRNIIKKVRFVLIIFFFVACHNVTYISNLFYSYEVKINRYQMFECNRKKIILSSAVTTTLLAATSICISDTPIMMRKKKKNE